MSDARTFKPRIPPLLGKPELDALHASALRVLETVGLHVADENCLWALEGHPSITRSGSRLHFDPAFVDQEVARHRERSKPPAVDETAEPSLAAGSHATHYVDVETDEVIPLSREACVAITRAMDGLRERGLRGSCPGAPQDLAPGLREVAQALIGWENSREGGVAPITEMRAFEFIHEMNQVMGRASGVGIHVVSPLRMEGIEYDIAVRFASPTVPIHVGSMPIMGVSAPIFPAGAFTVAVAEVIGSWLAVRLFLEGVPAGFSFDVYSVDMKSGGFMFGNPEQKLLDLIKRDVNAYYHTSKPPRAMYSMARRPGAQSCAEMASLAAVDALCGARRFWGVGLRLDEVCSLEQYVLCLEMMRSALRIADGVQWDEEALAADVIEQVLGQGGSPSFMAHDSTLSSYRKVYWMPELWDRNPLASGAWREMEPARERAKQIAREAVSLSEFRLDEGKSQALRDIYQRAEEAYAGR